MVTHADDAALEASPPWTCPACGSERPSSDQFCGACGAASRPATPRPAAIAPAGQDRAGPSAALRTAILGVVLLGAVAVAVALGGGKQAGPGSVTSEPTPWRCDGSERAWTAAIPASAPELVVELHASGPDGPVVVATPASRDALEPYRQPDGTYRVTSTDPGAPECGVPPGRYVLVVRDAGSGDTVASGEVTIEP